MASPAASQLSASQRQALPEPPDAGSHRHRSLDPILLIGSVIVLAALLTWILPAGRFQRVHDARTGQTLVVPGSYERVARHPVGPWGMMLSIPQGLIDAAEVVFFVLLGGGALTVVESTGAIANFLDHLVHRLGRRPLLVLALASVLFLVGGGTNNMYEEILAFIPLLCLLTRRLGLNSEMALAISVGTASMAAAFSPADAFILPISQPIAEVPVFSGFLFRGIVFLCAVVIWGGYLAWYSTRYRRNHPLPEQEIVHAAAPVSPWKARDIVVLAALNLGMLAIVLGGIYLGWDLVHYGAVFIVMGIVAGLAGGLGPRGTAEQFAEGFRRMALAALLVGVARSVSVVLSHGLVLDTIAHALFAPLRHFSLWVAGIMMYLAESVLALPMPSDSGRSLVAMPIMVPLSDLLGLSRQMLVNINQYSTLTSSLIVPTSGGLLAMLAMAKIPFGRWLRFIIPPVLLLSLLVAVAIVVGVKLGVH